MQDILNGVPLTTAQHLGSHPNYTSRVTAELDKIVDRLNKNGSFTPENAYHEIVDLTNRIKQAIINNPNTPIDQIIF
ncbi:MAG: AHH domain-containing protein [Sphingobacteriales bacterium]|nr:AHH domain-containing protein [Sphingobacteriales bacterium]